MIAMRLDLNRSDRRCEYAAVFILLAFAAMQRLDGKAQDVSYQKLGVYELNGFTGDVVVNRSPKALVVTVGVRGNGERPPTIGRIDVWVLLKEGASAPLRLRDPDNDKGQSPTFSNPPNAWFYGFHYDPDVVPIAVVLTIGDRLAIFAVPEGRSEKAARGGN